MQGAPTDDVGHNVPCRYVWASRGKVDRMPVALAAFAAGKIAGVAWLRLDDNVWVLVNGEPVCRTLRGAHRAKRAASGRLGLVEAAALPEAFFTVWNSWMWPGRLAPWEPSWCGAAPATPAQP